MPIQAPRILRHRCAFLLFASATPSLAVAQQVRTDTLRIPGLVQPVEVLRDKWGVAHIYARNERDLFFAQGYTGVRDRGFQFEMWRRQATGTMAEVFGRRELLRDQGTRLFRYRGSLPADLARYHPRGAAIVGAFVDGVNAFVEEARRDPSLVPADLRMLGMTPGRWTPDVVISRHQGLLGNVTEELANGRFVARHGASLLKRIQWFHPGPEPELDLDPAIDGAALDAPILALYEAFRAPVRFEPSDVVAAMRSDSATARRIAVLDSTAQAERQWSERRDIGSNNWVLSGRHTASGRALMANDPHRAIAAPSLRYFVHLSAPGWNVVGGGEPTVPGVSIGHNEHGAWGLTIFNTDGEDLYVYRTHPTDPSRYWYRGGWERMQVLREAIPVRGEGRVQVALRYTRHGPMVYQDSARRIAYAVRAAWLEPGGAPYLASLRMDQARSWEEFRAACAFSNIPGENMIWADVRGNIGWQAVGIAPVRPRSSGLVPVPGDGRYDWAGYLPMLQKPHAYNPASGIIATANNNVTPAGYPHRDAIGWTWADPWRWSRITEVLGAGRKVTMDDMMRLQTDYASLPARSLVPLLRGVVASDSATERARRSLLAWDHVLHARSVPAGIYQAWYRALAAGTTRLVVPEPARAMARGIPVSRFVEWLTAPEAAFAPRGVARRDSLLLASLATAVRELTAAHGIDTSAWAWGQSHRAMITHPLSPVLSAEQRTRYDVGPWPRGGDGNTVGATGNGPVQLSGASFRYIVEAGDWDRSMGTNTPGQSGDVRSPHYRDLFELWKEDRYFPVAFSRRAVEGVTEARVVMMPGRR